MSSVERTVRASKIVTAPKADIATSSLDNVLDIIKVFLLLPTSISSHLFKLQPIFRSSFRIGPQSRIYSHKIIDRLGKFQRERRLRR